MKAFLFDLRRASRILRRSPGFVAVTVLALGLGIGASTAIFTLVEGVMLDPLPYPEPDRLVWLGLTAPGINFPSLVPTPGVYAIYRERSETLEEVGYWSRSSLTLTGHGDPVRVSAAVAGSSLFQVLRATPLNGRLLTAEDDELQSHRVALLSYGLWQRHFGGGTDVVGRAIELDGSAHEIVGILPAGFALPDPNTELWIDSEIRTVADGFGRFGGFNAVGRLRDGVTLDDARRDLDARLAELLERSPGQERRMIADARLASRPMPLKSYVVGSSAQRTLWILFGAVCFVLLIACANVANLFLVRAQVRQRETAVRTALGAHRAHLARHFLAESTLLAVLGGAVGLLLALAGVRYLVRSAPATIPRLQEVSVDAGALTFAAAVTLIAALLFGVAPIARGGVDLVARLKEGGPGAPAGRRRLLRRLLVVSQVALALVLLVGSALMARSFRNLHDVDPAFDAGHVLRFSLALPRAEYPEASDAAAFHEEALRRLAALPGVVSVGAAAALPLEGGRGAALLYEEGEDVPDGALPPLISRNRVTEGYLETFRIPRIAGRALNAADGRERTGAIVINQALAELYWPGESPLGKRVRTDRSFAAGEPRWLTVVGVVGHHEKRVTFAGPPDPMVMMPMLGGDSDAAHSMSYGVRTAVPPLSLAAAVRASIWELDPDLPLLELGTMTQVVEAAGAPAAFTLLLLVLASGIALVLGSVGIYGVLSYLVRERTGEIGVRMTLGARDRDVLRMVLTQGAAIGAVGVATGLAASFFLVRTLSSLLHGVDPLDPSSHLGVAAVLFGVVLLSAYVPARRAARVDPLKALRSE